MACKTKQRNTNAGRCKYGISLIRRAIVVPEGTEFSGPNFDDWLMSKIHDADPSKRAYPMPQFTGIADNSEDVVTTTNGYGKSKIMRDGSISFTQNYAKNSCLSARLTDFNDGVMRGIYLLDSAGRVWGTKGLNGGLKAFSATIFCKGEGLPQADSEVEPTIRYDLDNIEEWNRKEDVLTELAVSDIEGLEDLELVLVKNSSNIEIKAVTACSKDDVTEELAELGGEADAWIGVKSNGTEETLATAPTYDDDNKKFTIAATALSAYTALKLADPSILYGIGVGYKCCDEATEIPA